MNLIKKCQSIVYRRIVISLGMVCMILVANVNASAPITSFLFLIPSVKIQYSFGEKNGFGLGLDAGMYFSKSELLLGGTLGIDYNFIAKEIGLAQTASIGTPYFGIKTGGYLVNKKYCPQVGGYAGYLLGYGNFMYTFIQNQATVGIMGDCPIFINGFTDF